MKEFLKTILALLEIFFCYLWFAVVLCIASTISFLETTVVQPIREKFDNPERKERRRLREKEEYYGRYL